MFEKPVFEKPVSEKPVSDQALTHGYPFDDGFEDHFEPEPTATPHSPVPSPDPNSGWSIAALVVGVGIVAIALSGLLDDSGLLEHPAWVVPAAAFLAGCFAVIAQTIRRLVRSPA